MREESCVVVFWVWSRRQATGDRRQATGDRRQAIMWREATLSSPLMLLCVLL
ncbi:MAG: hypothetical protein ACTTIZ_05100 [Treponema sp.]